MWLLIGRLVTWALARKVVLATSGAAVGEAWVTLDGLRSQAAVEAGASDIQALDEAARTAARLLGLDGSHVLWPMDRLGNHIAPKYFHVDLVKGRAWFTATYTKRRRFRSFGRGGSSYNRMSSIARRAVVRSR